jgi:hypothetical protein
MPAPLSRGDRRLLLSGGAVFVALIALAAFLSTGAGNSTGTPTTYATDSSGAKAAYLLLQSSGYRVERWEQPVQELPDPRTATLILAEPIEAPTDADRATIHRFIERGGRAIATGAVGASFLSGGVAPDPVAGLTWIRAQAASPSAITRAAPTIVLAPQASWGTLAFGVPLYSNDAHAPLVVRIPAGAGEAFWWASATPLTNAGITEPGNLEFFLACIGPPGGRRVLFDEYVHGHRRTLAASMWRSPVKWVLLQLGVVAFVLLATYSRRSGPILLPAMESRLSPLEFVRTLGSLYARAGAASVAVDMAYQRFRYWLTRRLGIAPHASVTDVEHALSNRPQIDCAALGTTMRACEAARTETRLDARTALALVRSLGNFAVLLKLFGGGNVENGARGLQQSGARGLQPAGTPGLKTRGSI